MLLNESKQIPSFEDGVCRICAVRNAAPVGKQPVEVLTERFRLLYQERQLGLTRYYTALQADVKISRVIRCLWRAEVSPQDVVIDERGEQFRIALIQKITNIQPPCMDLSLGKVEKVFQVSATNEGV